MEITNSEVSEVDNRPDRCDAIRDGLKAYILNPENAEVGKHLVDLLTPINLGDFKEMDDVRADSLNLVQVLRQNDLQEKVREIYELSNSIVVRELETKTLSILAKIACGRYDKALEQAKNLAVTFPRSGFAGLFLGLLSCQLNGPDVSQGIVSFVKLVAESHSQCFEHNMFYAFLLYTTSEDWDAILHQCNITSNLVPKDLEIESGILRRVIPSSPRRQVELNALRGICEGLKTEKGSRRKANFRWPWIKWDAKRFAELKDFIRRAKAAKEQDFDDDWNSDTSTLVPQWMVEAEVNVVKKRRRRKKKGIVPENEGPRELENEGASEFPLVSPHQQLWDFLSSPHNPTTGLLLMRNFLYCKDVQRRYLEDTILRVVYEEELEPDPDP